MRGGLAGRWIGLHAAAFALSAFVGAVYFNVGGHLSERGLHVFQAVGLGLPMSLAFELAVLGRGFPGHPAFRILAMTAGVGLGSAGGFWAMSAFIKTTSSLRRAEPEWISGLGYFMVGVMMAAEGTVLGLAQASALARRLPIRTLLIWGVGVAGAWTASELASYLPHWLGFLKGGLPGRSVDLSAVFQWMALAAGQGAIYSAVLFPVLRRILREEHG